MSRWTGEAPRSIDQVEPGYYLMRLVKGGPLVPARIMRIETDAALLWAAEIDGMVFLAHPDPDLADNVARIWTTAARATQAEYDHRTALRRWAKVHAPNHPAANPNRPINLATMPSIY